MEEEITETNNEETEEIKSEANTLVDDANLAAKRLEDANKDKKDLLDREEQLIAKKALGGNTEAGQSIVKEESDKEYAMKAIAGNFNDK